MAAIISLRGKEAWPRWLDESMQHWGDRLHRNRRREKAKDAISELVNIILQSTRQEGDVAITAIISASLENLWESASGMSIEYEIERPSNRSILDALAY